MGYYLTSYSPTRVWRSPSRNLEGPGCLGNAPEDSQYYSRTPGAEAGLPVQGQDSRFRDRAPGVRARSPGVSGYKGRVKHDVWELYGMPGEGIRAVGGCPWTAP